MSVARFLSIIERKYPVKILVFAHDMCGDIMSHFVISDINYDNSAAYEDTVVSFRNNTSDFK